MSAATETRGPAREVDTAQAPAPDPARDLETALAGLAFQAGAAGDFPLDVVDAVRRLLLPDLPVAEWDAYVLAVENVWKLQRGANPFEYCEADPEKCTPEAAHEFAVQDWQASGDAALKFLLAAAIRRYETLPATTQESA